MLHQKAKITQVKQEGSRVKTFYFELDIEAQPGQFVMAWLPGVDEKPFCIAGTKPFALSVAKVGPFSAKMHELKKGDYVWIRGPFGKPFTLVGKKVVMVGGGYGVAPLRFLAKEAKKKKIKTKFIMGARTHSDLMDAPKVCIAAICTDDGSMGKKGRVTELLDAALKEKPDCVYACGPEKMLFRVMEMCEKAHVECQLSLERYMKCGFGLCGQCSISGLMVCKDGPVFTGKELKKIPDFGKGRLDATGKKISE
jgi:dihydroorotate dehydrogenase electron transfer subunit